MSKIRISSLLKAIFIEPIGITYWYINGEMYL